MLSSISDRQSKFDVKKIIKITTKTSCNTAERISYLKKIFFYTFIFYLFIFHTFVFCNLIFYTLFFYTFIFYMLIFYTAHFL